MSKKAEAVEVAAFDLDELDAIDEAEMTVVVNGKPTAWTWRFAGPGHAKTIAQSERLAREALHHQRQIETKRNNGKKWTAPEETPSELVDRNVNLIVERLLGWSDVTIGGKPLPFSAENARTLLKDPRKGQLLVQALEFLGDETAFSNRSASN